MTNISVFVLFQGARGKHGKPGKPGHPGPPVSVITKNLHIESWKLIHVNGKVIHLRCFFTGPIWTRRLARSKWTGWASCK